MKFLCYVDTLSKLEGEGERGIAVLVMCFLFLVIAMIRPNTYSIQFLLAPSTIAKTFSFEILNINYHKQRALCLWFLLFFQSTIPFH